jgi:hypothetical protein
MDVPCQPSAVVSDLPRDYLSSREKGSALKFRAAYNRLVGLYSKSRGRIPCAPRYQVVEDGARVGILTQTHQLVTVQPEVPTEDNDDVDLPVYPHRFVEREDGEDASWGVEQDPERRKQFRNLHLETQFYATFRELVHQLLHKPEFHDIRDSLQRQVESIAISYRSKMKFLEKQLRVLTEKFAVFQSFDDAVLDTLRSVLVCTSSDKQPYCLTKTGEESTQTVFPKLNLMDAQIDNRISYVQRLADDILRNRRVQLRMFRSSVPLAIDPVEFSVFDNEVVVPWSSLRDEEEYGTVWDTANAGLHTYVQPPKRIKKRVAGVWRPVFPSDVQELIFASSEDAMQCVCRLSGALASALAGAHCESPRQVLDRAYRVTKLREVLQRVVTTTQEDRPVNDVDWWAFCRTLQIPAVLFSASSLQFSKDMNWLRLFSTPGTGPLPSKYIFIRALTKRGGQREYQVLSRPIALTELDTSQLQLPGVHDLTRDQLRIPELTMR